MNNTKDRGMWKRTFGIYTKFRIPWLLYLFQTGLGIVSTKVALMYVPYETSLKTGNVSDPAIVLGYVLFLLLATGVQIAGSIPSFYANNQVSRNLQNTMIRHAVRLPMTDYEESGTAIVSWITQDAPFASGLITSVIGFITGIAATIMSVRQMGAIDMTMVWLVPVIVIYILFATWLEGKLMFLRERRGRRASSELTAYMAEHLSFLVQIRQMGTHREELERGKAAIQDNYKADIYMAVLTLVNNVFNGSLTTVMSILIFVLGVPKVNDGTITLQELAAFQSYILIAYQSLSSLPGLYTSLMYYNGQLFYIAGLLDKKPEVYERSREMAEVPAGDITFSDVSFAYGDRPVIENASFTIPRGKTTLLVGPNGSGKSTLFKLIERFYVPASGKICLGDVPAEEISLSGWRRNFAYVLQDPQLFDGTVRENIVYGMDREVSDEEVEKAAALACADEFIKDLPEGYGFVIGENGSRLSAGQRQRLAIARAVLLDPPCLLLDEATCNMDVLSEQQVSAALRGLMNGRTTVMISHDMEALSDADHVIVLADGRVEAEGTREEAVERSAMLRRLIAASE